MCQFDMSPLRSGLPADIGQKPTHQRQGFSHSVGLPLFYIGGIFAWLGSINMQSKKTMLPKNWIIL